jgi:WD40 repeat protein
MITRCSLDVVCESVHGVGEHAVHSLAFSHDSQFLAGAGEDSTIAVVRVATGEVENPKKRALAYGGSGSSSRSACASVVVGY